jgi:ketosteroid isomerase-like protein
MSQENVEAVRRSLEAWNRGDVDAWLQPSHPDIEWISEVAQRVEGSETVYRGQAELRRYWEDWHSLWEVKIHICELRERDDIVVALGRIQTRGEASGIDLDRPIAYVFEFDKGAARRVRSYFDQQQALEAAGLAG